MKIAPDRAKEGRLTSYIHMQRGKPGMHAHQVLKVPFHSALLLAEHPRCEAPFGWRPGVHGGHAVRHGGQAVRHGGQGPGPGPDSPSHHAEYFGETFVGHSTKWVIFVRRAIPSNVMILDEQAVPSIQIPVFRDMSHSSLAPNPFTSSHVLRLHLLAA